MSTPQRIEAALSAGEIDQGTANLYLAYALGDYEKLPAKYHGNVPWDGTLPLLRLRRAMARMRVDPRQTEVATILAGICSSSSTTLPNTLNSTHFHIQYDTVGGELNIDDYQASLETTWTTEVDSFGWAAPPVLTSNPPDGDRYHVRIDDLGGDLYGYVSDFGVHAGFVGDNPDTAWTETNARASCMVLNSDYGGFPSSPQASLEATVAHEFVHSIQFGYGVLGAANEPDDAFVEGGATWMEDEVFDSSNDNYGFLWPSFDTCMGNYTEFPYAYWITFRGFTERYGIGTAGAGEQVMQDFWENVSQGATMFPALEAALSISGTTLADAYHAYAIAVKFNKPCGCAYVYPYCFEEGPGYVAAAGGTSVHGSIGTVGGSYADSVQNNYALNWISLPTGSDTYAVTLENTSTIGGQLRASVVCDTGSTLNVTPLPAVVTPGSSSTLGSFDPSGCSSVVAVITNQEQTADNPTICQSRSYQLSTKVATSDFKLGVAPAALDVCAPGDAVYTVTVGSLLGLSDPVTLSVTGEPSGTTTSFSPTPVIPAVPPATSTLTISGTGGAMAGGYSIGIVGTAPTSTHTTTVTLNLFDAVPGTVNPVSPANGAESQPLLPTLTWTSAAQGESYLLEVATDPGFGNVVYSATITGTGHTLTSSLSPGTLHYWRVTPRNLCGSGSASATFAFSTVLPICSTPNLAIPDGDPAGITDTLTVTNTGVLVDLDVFVEATHPWVGDLVFTLRHVDTGTSVTIIDRPGDPAIWFGCEDDDIEAALDDEAALPVEDACGSETPTIFGTFVPNNPLSDFDGEGLDGGWTMTASDIESLESGTLVEWCLLPTTVPSGTAVAISGPMQGAVNHSYTFTATVSPVTATLPMTYLWQATDRTPVTHTGGITDTVLFAWSGPGTKVITVTATNADWSLSDTYTIAVRTRVYLPLVLRDSGMIPLSEVDYWAYQLQGISQPGAVDALVASHYDLLVLEPTRTDQGDASFDTQGMVAQLKASPASDGGHKLIVAYIDIGEAEDWRWYWDWSTDWDCTGDPPTDWPGYILACDPDGWGGNYPVAYWDPLWKDIIIYGENQPPEPGRDYTSAIDEAILDGFDGIYLDWVEGYEDEAVVAAAQAAGKDPAAEMIAFIQEMRDYATARDSDFVIIQQNAAALSDGHSELYGLIDGIAQEEVWYGGDATDDWNDPDGYDWVQPPSLTDYYIGYLEGYLDAGLPVFNCEYALTHADTAYANSYNEGYVPYVSHRSLSRLTTTPPPGY